MKRRGYRISSADVKQFIDLYTAGYGSAEIAEKTGWSNTCIKTNLHKHGINLVKQGTRRKIKE